MTVPLHLWWQTAVFYQVYLPGFASHSAWENPPRTPGTGDLRGVAEHLDYLQDLGIDALEISPIVDGLDVDLVAQEYGTLDDLSELLDCAHQRNMRLVLDLLFDRVSDHSLWFPLQHQPRFQTHPPRGESVSKVMLAWLQRGVDGFRLRSDRKMGVPKDLLALMADYPDRILLRESTSPRLSRKKSTGISNQVNFYALLNTPRLMPESIVTCNHNLSYDLQRGDWPTVALGDFASPRLLNRFCLAQNGHSQNVSENARLWAALILTLPGTPFLYYGDEIGMVDLGGLVAESTLSVPYPNNSPMQWSRQANAGFCPQDVDPLLMVNPNYLDGINVADQLTNPASLLCFYQRLIRMRRSSPALSSGDFQSLTEDQDCLVYLRRCPEQTCLVGINFSTRLHTCHFSLEYLHTEVLFSNWGREGERGKPEHLALAPYEIYIAEVL